MVRMILINALNESELFSEIDLIGSDPATDLDLESLIESFDQVIEGKDNYAEFKLILEFRRSDTGASVWNHRVSARVKQEGKRVCRCHECGGRESSLPGARGDGEIGEVEGGPREVDERQEAERRRIGESGWADLI